MTSPSPKVWLPKYAEAQYFLRIMEGESYVKYRLMLEDIASQAGSRQSIVDWSDPDSWIPSRLNKKPDSCDLAMRLWRQSDRLINPRWSYEIWRFVRSYSFADIQHDTFVTSERGQRFLADDATAIFEIDQNEMLLILLSDIADKGSGTRRDFIDAYESICQRYTKWKYGSIVNSFSARVKNLAARKLIAVQGHTYQITDDGLKHLQRASGSDEGSALGVQLLANQKNSTVRRQLAEYLQTMDPTRFEHLIKWLLEEMGYQNVEVPGGSNDKGVDVVGDITLGISSVREVIQVKRWKDKVNRPVLDQLRGSLHYFEAVRGTIITTSGFTKGTKESAFLPGVAPITLIDGETLLDLLIEHNIGVRRREIRILEFDAESLSEFESEEELEAAALEEPESE
ncbi:MAG: restriction endonuclease [Chloroflexi bacterium]|nr:restriction endonuclease [Chloroflexota bacterium]